MSDGIKKPTDFRRQQHNNDLIRRMRSGEPLNAIDSKARWFPPRPVIEKDQKEIARVYSGSSASIPAAAKKTHHLRPIGPSDYEVSEPSSQTEKTGKVGS